MRRKNRQALEAASEMAARAHVRISNLETQLTHKLALIEPTLDMCVEEIQAVEATLGIMPHGNSRDVAARLDMMMSLIHTHAELFDAIHNRRRFPWKLRTPWVRR